MRPSGPRTVGRCSGRPWAAGRESYRSGALSAIRALSGDAKLGGKNPSFRDPVTLSFSEDGLSWGGTAVAITCTDLSPTSTCKLRYPGASKNGGPSYPQALTVTAPAPAAVQGLYVASSNNKEDIWVVKVEP